MQTKILRIDASPRYENSVSRKRADAIIKDMSFTKGDINVTVRDVSRGLPFVSRDWIKLKSKPLDEGISTEHSIMDLSRRLINELKENEHYIFACPIYNFMIPASLKAWVDLVALPGRTFQVSDDGYTGLLNNKSATLIFSSSNTDLGSKRDYASLYLISMLKFMGVEDIESIGGKSDIPIIDIVEDYRSQVA